MEPYGGRPPGRDGNEEERGTWEEINGPGGCREPVLDLAFLYPLEVGEDNQA